MMMTWAKRYIPVPIKTQYRKVRPRQPDPQTGWRYQAVTCHLFPRRLLEGEFSAVHERVASQDPHISFDIDLTRMRSYFIYSFARLAIEGTDGPRDAMFVGIAFGTAPLTSVELLCEVPKVSFLFIDPFDGRGRDDYNDDVEFVRSRIPDGSRVTLVVGAVPECLGDPLLEGSALAFAHMNTGSISSEIATLQYIGERLLPGGFVVWDTYGWTAAEKQREIDQLLRSMRFSSFVLPTGQLILTKPS